MLRMPKLTPGIWFAAPGAWLKAGAAGCWTTLGAVASVEFGPEGAGAGAAPFGAEEVVAMTEEAGAI